MKKGKPKNRSSPATAGKSGSSSIGVNSFSPSRADPPAQIPGVEPTIRLSKRVQISAQLSGESGIVTIAFSDLLTGVPGGLTYWHKFRVERVDIWGDQVLPGDTDNTIRVTLAASSDWSQPNFQVFDAGTVGVERPRVGFRLGLLDRSRWISTGYAEPMFVVAGPPDSRLIIQASIELVSPSSTLG